MRTLLCLLLFLLPFGCAGGGAKGDLHTMPVTVIEGEEVWSGEVVIDRIVIVKRGGHLKIEPGTRVLFERVDWDGDKIGDAEITVEGRFTAVGTSAAPILFASREEEPLPGDWKYLHINFAEGAKVSHLLVAHAYSGLQVHYSQAEVADSYFVNNVDGVRFSTARLTLERSVLTANRNGIRFEERGHPAVVRGNAITGNKVGIFAVAQWRE